MEIRLYGAGPSSFYLCEWTLRMDLAGFGHMLYHHSYPFQNKRWKTCRNGCDSLEFLPLGWFAPWLDQVFTSLPPKLNTSSQGEDLGATNGAFHYWLFWSGGKNHPAILFSSRQRSQFPRLKFALTRALMAIWTAIWIRQDHRSLRVIFFRMKYCIIITLSTKIILNLWIYPPPISHIPGNLHTRK